MHYAYILKRGQQYVARVIEHNGQFIDGHTADAVREVIYWLIRRYPEVEIAPAPGLAEEFRQKEKDNAQ